MATSPHQIHLTAKERQIFDRLLQVHSHFNLQTHLRVAGGWVRDKLLEKECNDIDLAVDDMLGREFCEKVNDYLKLAGEKSQEIHLINCNPNQSKHLETAKMCLYDVCLDVVNLRSEDYSENSRIPTMRFGTAEEDAYRRDLTINSLFYNINTRSVEDFTKRGIADLKSGKIVTPLPPKQTFLDDPLRVLRAIHFGARFGFKLDEELKIAAADNDVKAAIADKISRERIGQEIDLMISGNDPVRAMTHISELQLFSAIFSLPSEIEPSISQGYERLSVTYMDSTWSLLQLVGCSSFTDDQKRLCLYASLLLPFKSSVYKDEKGKKVPVVSYIFSTALKSKARDAETGCFFEIKEFWRAVLGLSLLLYPNDVCSSNNSSNEVAKLNERRELYKRVENAILEMGLEKIWEMKPLLNGKDIMSFLPLKTGGPLVREWQEKLLEWQLANPFGTAEGCMNWMMQTQSKRAQTE